MFAIMSWNNFFLVILLFHWAVQKANSKMESATRFAKSHHQKNIGKKMNILRVPEGMEGSSGEGEYVSSNNPELRLLDFDPDYDFNLLPPRQNGKAVMVNVSLNLRNILQVCTLCANKGFPSSVR